MDINSIKLSRRALLGSAAGLSATAMTGQLSGAWGTNAQRPRRRDVSKSALFAGDYADASILRVGGDFYATHTCYKYAPGLRVWHSRDMVNWTHISDALGHSYGEVWAPDLVEHQGHYFIYFPLDGRLTVVHAPTPRGPWSEPISLGIGDIDPGHVAGPEGTRYLYSAGGKVVQLSPDGLSVAGRQKHVYDGWQFPKEWQTEGFWLESPKLTQRGGYYYVTCAEGGTAGPPTSHMAVVARSKSPLGPWENSPYNPLIHTYSADEAWWSVGHGTLVSTPDDRWYFVYHGYRNGLTTLGRHTLMEPIEWTQDGWPRALQPGARRGDPMPAPMGVAQRPMPGLSDDFRAPTLKPTWWAWNESDMSRFETGRGALIIRAKGDSPAQSSPLTVMARDASYQAQVLAAPQGDSGAALGLFYNPENWLFAELRNSRLRVYGAKRTLTSRAWQAGAAHLKIVNRHNRVEFLASENGRDWQSLIADFDASGFNQNTLHGFQALRPTLAAFGTGAGRFAHFEYRAL